jgi:hypothetical protein
MVAVFPALLGAYAPWFDKNCFIVHCDPEAGCEPPAYDLMQIGCGGEVLVVPLALAVCIYLVFWTFLQKL